MVIVIITKNRAYWMVMVIITKNGEYLMVMEHNIFKTFIAYTLSVPCPPGPRVPRVASRPTCVPQLGETERHRWWGRCGGGGPRWRTSGTWPSWAQRYTTFSSRNLPVFVLGRPFQPVLMFVDQLLKVQCCTR